MEQNLIVDFNPEKLSKDEKEFKRFLSVINAMEQYYNEGIKYVDKMEKDFQTLDQKYISKLRFNYKDRISRLKESLTHNQNLLNHLIKLYKPPPSYYTNINLDDVTNNRFEEGNFLYNIFTYIVRDWSIDREEERKETYNLLINEVLKYYPSSKDGSINRKILIPGSGLNRLGYELCKLGFDVEANDYLYLNGFFSDLIFNHAKKGEFFVYTNIDSFSNFWEEESVFKKYIFPDVDIDLKNNKNYGKLNFSIGDFVQLYNNNNEYFDCVITCYFIDTAQNIIQYIDIIYNVLKKGGLWINFGPLSYHWSTFPEYTSIELPYDKLKEVILNYGFDYINESFKYSTFGYMDGNMHNDLFKCINFSVIKK